MDGKCGRLSHSKIHGHVAKLLNAKNLGTSKTAKQCQLKLRKLRKEYLSSKDNNNRSGHARSQCANYEALDTLFGRRPRTVSHSWGFDSSNTVEGTDESSADNSVPEDALDLDLNLSGSSLTSSAGASTNNTTNKNYRRASSKSKIFSMFYNDASLFIACNIIFFLYRETVHVQGLARKSAG